jgi:hypothetical protein
MIDVAYNAFKLVDMWNADARFRREEDGDAFQMSPCLTASSGLLTPPSSYNIDTRRNSVASSLSSLGPTTPIYARHPFSDHGYSNVTNMEPCQDHSMNTLTLGFNSFKPTGQEGQMYEGWSTLAQPDGLDHTVPVRMAHGFVSHPSLVQSPMASFTGIDNQASPMSVSCTTSFSNSPYAEYQEQMQDETDHAQTGQGLWSYQYALANMMAAPTMAPNEALLGGEYVHVDTGNHDTDMSSYDDSDGSLEHSPRDIVVKQENTESPTDERRITRSIWVSSTGGKSVKKEEQAGMTKKKVRKSRSKAITRLHGERYEIWMDDDMEQIPGTKKWRRNGGSLSGKPQICEIEVAGVPCGRKFQRQEHLHRHMKTHSGRKDFVCQLCLTEFNRNDNCWEHYWTHVHRPGKKNGRNKKHSLRRVLTYITDPKHTEKLLNKWRKEVGYEYDPENDPQVQDEEHHEQDVATPSPAADKDLAASSAAKQSKYAVRSRL